MITSFRGRVPKKLLVPLWWHPWSPLPYDFLHDVCNVKRPQLWILKIVGPITACSLGGMVMYLSDTPCLIILSGHDYFERFGAINLQVSSNMLDKYHWIILWRREFFSCHTCNDHDQRLFTSKRLQLNQDKSMLIWFLIKHVNNFVGKNMRKSYDYTILGFSHFYVKIQNGHYN